MLEYLSTFICLRVPFDHVTIKPHELSSKIINGERPELGSGLSKKVADLLKRFRHIYLSNVFNFTCSDVDVSRRPKINDVLKFSKNTVFKIPGN